MNETAKQITAALWVAFSEAAGGDTARRVISRVIDDAIIDHAIDDPAAICFLTSLAKDEGRADRDAEIASAA